MSAKATNLSPTLAGASPHTQPEAFAKALVQWFVRHRRDLPWRRDVSAYKTVVSELMLQQTQVATALPYFERWVARWPDFASLAAADEAQVLQMWEGLGYYSRARNLLKLARAWVAAADKPQSAAQWLEYPGVGPYTAAAIASIAFGEHAAVVDGNVVRVLARLSADTTAYRNAALAVKALTPLAQSVIVHAERPGLHNEAMMELGATLCRKGQPQCLLCPVRAFCLGQQLGGELAQLPRIARKQTENRVVTRAFVLDAGQKQVLLHRYGAASRRLAGLCELPLWETVAAAAGAASGDGVNRKGTGKTLAACKITPAGNKRGGAVADRCVTISPAGEPLLVKSRGIANERIEERFYAWPQAGGALAAFAKWGAALADGGGLKNLAGGIPVPSADDAGGDELFWQPLAALDAVTLTGPHRRWLALLLKDGNSLL